jgi:hypothetical protein
VETGRGNLQNTRSNAEPLGDTQELQRLVKKEGDASIPSKLSGGAFANKSSGKNICAAKLSLGKFPTGVFPTGKFPAARLLASSPLKNDRSCRGAAQAARFLAKKRDLPGGLRRAFLFFKRLLDRTCQSNIAFPASHATVS